MIPYAPLFASILVAFFHPSNGAYVSELIQFILHYLLPFFIARPY